MIDNFSSLGVTIWLTGLSGAGKTTIAQHLEKELLGRRRKVEVLDGDLIRNDLSKELGYSKEDRDTNIQRIAFVADLLTRNDVLVIVAAISPYREARDKARQLIGNFVEVFVDCPLDELIRRDAKGLYQRALRGEISGFTRISDPYEPPLNPEGVVCSEKESVESCCAKIIDQMDKLSYSLSQTSESIYQSKGA
jgi:adenylylsulfate kinase